MREPEEHPNVAKDFRKCSRLILFPTPSDVTIAPLNEIFHGDGDRLLHEEYELAYVLACCMKDVYFVKDATHCKRDVKLQIRRCGGALSKPKRTSEKYPRLLDHLQTRLTSVREFLDQCKTHTAN